MSPTVSEIRAREQAATEGPWLPERPKGEIEGFKVGMIIAAVARGQIVWADPPGGVAPEANRRFIAHSRTDIPYLLRLVERMGIQTEMMLQDDYTKHMHRDDVREARALLKEIEL